MPIINGPSANYHLSNDKRTLYTPNGELWTLTHLLEGRGQAGFAGFYQDSQHRTYLVKQDKKGVCLAEASATNSFLPQAHQKSINCAEIGCLGDELITIQPRVQGAPGTSVEPLDKLVYGRKRRPKTLRSEESRHRQEIQDFIEHLKPAAKRDIAAALFASTALGDESVHLGQFMATTLSCGQEKNIERIVRVDFGARERYTKARFENNCDFYPTKTSYAYKKSGQFGKDYISYLVANNKLRASLLCLWAKENIDEMAYKQLEKLQQQLASIPLVQQKEALTQFLSEINARSKKPIVLDKNLNFENQKKQFFDEYESLLVTRCEHMQQHAKNEIKQIISQAPLSSEQKSILNQFFTENDIDPNHYSNIKSIHDELFQPTEVSEHSMLIQLIEARMEWCVTENQLEETSIDDIHSTFSASTDYENQSSTASILSNLSLSTTHSVSSISTLTTDDDYVTSDDEAEFSPPSDEQTSEEEQEYPVTIKHSPV